MRKILISSIFFLTVSVFGCFSSARAATVQELQQQINSHNQTIQQLEDEISKYQVELDKTSTQAKTLQSTIKDLDLNAKKLQASLDLTKSKIDNTNLTIEKLSKDIGNKQDQIDENHMALATTLRQTYERDAVSLFEIFLTYPNTSQFWNEFDTTSQFQGKVKDHTDILRSLQKDLVNNKTQTQQKKDELVKLQNDLKDQKTVIDANKNEKNKLLSQTKNTEAGYKQLIASNETKKKAFQDELFQIESQLKVQIDPNSLPPERPGILAWPIAKHRVTQGYGLTDYAKAHPGLYKNQMHYAIDIAASIGTPVMSAGSGTVLGTGDTDKTCPGASYGKWVAIEHTNGLSTVYGHLSVVKVSKGQQVSVGDTIAYSGATGAADGPHLHFVVYASQGGKISTLKSASCRNAVYTIPIISLQAYLNPLLYL